MLFSLNFNRIVEPIKRLNCEVIRLSGDDKYMSNFAFLKIKLFKKRVSLLED